MGHIIAPVTVAALKHLSIHGTTSLSALKAAVPGLQTKTMANLVQIGNVLRTEAGHSITPKGRAKLKATEQKTAADATADTAGPAEQETPESHTMVGAASHPTALPVAAPAPSMPMLSNAEAEAAITAVLKRSRVRQSLPDIARRARMADHIVRPTLTTMVQQGKVETTSTKPALYRLVHARAALAPVHLGGGPSEHVNGYSCPELQRNPGLNDDRFAAFSLPSRMGDRLHWPDGRVTSVHDPR